MGNLFYDIVKECLFEKGLWKNGYQFKNNPDQRGQSFNFFIVDKNNKKVFIAKYFDYLADIRNENLEKIDEFDDIYSYIEWISNSDNLLDVEQIIEIIHYQQRAFKRYVSVCSDYECGFPRLYVNVDSVKINGSFYGLLVEEVIEGITLDKHLKIIKKYNKKNDVFSQALLFINEITNSLKVLNKNNIVHRDLSPDNIIYNGETYTLIDPGVIKMIDKDKTKTFGFIFGKRKYVSPEQFKGYASKADFTSDLYSLGIISFEFILGYNPLEKYIATTQDPHKSFFKNLNRDIEDDFFEVVDENSSTRRFYQLLCKMVQVEKRYRFKTMDEFIEFLSTITMEVCI